MWLPLLGLGVHDRGQGPYQAGFHQYPPWGQVSRRLKAPWDLPPLAGCLLGSVTERVHSCASRSSISHQVGGRVVFTNGVHRFKLGACAGPEATQQKSQCTPSQLPPSWGLCGGAGFYGGVREWPEEFIRLKQINIWPCVGRALHRNCGADGACEWEMAITGEPQNSASLCPSLSSSESG